MGFYRNSRSAYLKAEKAVKKALFFPMKSSGMDITDSESGESQDNKFVFTEMEEFVVVQFDQESHKQSEGEDVTTDEDGDPKISVEQKEREDGGWTEMHDIDKDEPQSQKTEEMTLTAPHTANVTGLAGVLDPQKNRSILRDSVQWGGYIQRFGKHGPTRTPKESVFGYSQTSFMGGTLSKRSMNGNIIAK